MLAIDLSIPSKIISSPNEIEVIVVLIFTKNPTTLCLVCNPPNSTTYYLPAKSTELLNDYHAVQ